MYHISFVVRVHDAVACLFSHKKFSPFGNFLFFHVQRLPVGGWHVMIYWIPISFGVRGLLTSRIANTLWEFSKDPA